MTTNDLSSIIAELKRLKEVKKENSACLERYDEINAEIAQEGQEALSEFANRLNDFKEKHSEKLEKFIPEDVYTYEEDIPVCDVEKIKPLYPISGLVFYAAFILFALDTGLKLGLGTLLGFICIVGIFVFGGIWFFKNGKIGDYFKWKKDRKKWLNDANKNEIKKHELLNAFRTFDDAFFAEMELYEKEEDNAAEAYMGVEEKIKEPYKEELDMLYEKITKCVYELTNSDVLHEDNVPYLEEILRNLETGRADSLKEAINIALDDERKDSEEAARRQEARRQEQILQEQAYQNKMHNIAMQQKADNQAAAARQHAAIMEKQAALQIKETQKLREEIKRQNARR